MQKSRIINTDEINSYLKDLKKIPVISHERQLEIFEQLKRKDITEKEKRGYHNELILGNLRFVVSIAKQFQNQGLDLSDLISEGNIGLIKSAERFDPSSGLRFISYAVWWIKQSMMSALNEYSRTIRIPSNLIQEIHKNKKIGGDNNINYTLPFCVGLNDGINEDGDELIDIIRDPNENNPEDVFDSKEELRKWVSAVLSMLDERERTIIKKYFGFDGCDANLDDLGDELKCTKERIRQLKDKSLKKLRNESYAILKYNH